mmetsp:Transcript_15855/g.26668  ORF Transcript_15855/g.26668 Transcript_15855/m.26668 type:complete len:450 (-) Transcript_15855:20-1369(-)
MKTSHLLVEVLGKNVHLSGLVGVLVLVLPQLDLGQSLVGEGGRHNEGRMASGATQVEQTTLRQHDHTVTIREHELVHLRLDVHTSCLGHQVLHVNLVIEVTNVTNDSIVLHLGHIGGHDDVLVTGGGDENITSGHNGRKLDDAETFHSRLQSANRIDLSDIHDGSGGFHGLSTTLSDITETADHSTLTSHHHISGTADTVGQRVLAPVQVVELGLGYGIVHVNGREKKFLLISHGVKSVHTGGGLLRNTNHACSKFLPLGRILGKLTGDDSENTLVLSIGSGGRVRDSLVGSISLLGLHTLMDEESHVSTIVDDKITTVTLVINRPGNSIEGALPVLLKGFTLPGKNSSRTIAGNSGGGVILSGEDVATAPSDFSTEGLESLDKDCSLDGHMQRTRNSGTFEELSTILSSASHKTRHLMFSKLDLLSAEVSKRDISNAEITSRHCWKIY